MDVWLAEVTPGALATFMKAQGLVEFGYAAGLRRPSDIADLTVLPAEYDRDGNQTKARIGGGRHVNLRFTDDAKAEALIVYMKRGGVSRADRAVRAEVLAKGWRKAGDQVIQYVRDGVALIARMEDGQEVLGPGVPKRVWL